MDKDKSDQRPGRWLAAVLTFAALGGRAEAARITHARADFWTSTLHLIERQGTVWSPPPPQPQGLFTVTTLLHDLGFDKGRTRAAVHAHVAATGLPLAVPPPTAPRPHEPAGHGRKIAEAQQVASPSPVPEPSTMAIACVLAGAVIVARRRMPFSAPPGPS